MIILLTKINLLFLYDFYIYNISRSIGTLLLLAALESELHLEALPEAVPGLALVQIVQFLPAQHQLALLHEAGVEPEVEGACTQP